MLSSNFIVRKSGINSNLLYIDFNGKYDIYHLQELTGISQDKIKTIYEKNGGNYSQESNVYYFDSKEMAQNAIDQLSKFIKPAYNVKTISFTEAEIEYIRKALINEESNIIFTKNKVRESIFQKLNN